MDFKLSLAFHLIGIVMWFGSHLILTRLLTGYVSPEKRDPALTALVGRVYFGFGLGGFILTVLSGVYQLLSRGMVYYMAQGWFHGKLTLVIIMFVVTAVLGVQISRVKKGEQLSTGVLMALHGATGVVLFGAVFATILGR